MVETPETTMLEPYRDHILDPGKQPLFLLFLGLLVGFLTVRTVVRMIRSGHGPFRNVGSGDLHIHHVVFGVVVMVAAGIAGFASGGRSPWVDVAAAAFGVGTALVLDEFALVLYLDDVYWQEKGRRSVDVTVVSIAATGLVLLGVSPLGEEDPFDASRWSVVAVLTLNLTLAVVTLFKGKLYLGVLGLFLPFIAFIGATRLATPGSPWARWRYQDEKMAKATVRAEGYGAAVVGWRRRLQDAIAGTPSQT